MQILVVVHHNMEKGFIALTSLIVISAAALATAVSISLLGVGEVNSSLDFKKGGEALKIAEGCVEESLLRLRDNAGYTGATLNIGDGSCTIIVTGTGADKIVNVEALIAGPPRHIKKIQVDLKRTGNSVSITNWKQVE